MVALTSYPITEGHAQAPVDILVVDDNVDVGIFAARYLKEAGFRLRVVRSGEEALRAMADGRPASGWCSPTKKCPA